MVLTLLASEPFPCALQCIHSFLSNACIHSACKHFNASLLYSETHVQLDTICTVILHCMHAPSLAYACLCDAPNSQQQTPCTHPWPRTPPQTCPQFCDKYTLKRLQNLPEVAGCEAKLRMDGDKPYVTDNSNYIVDLYFQVRCPKARKLRLHTFMGNKAVPNSGKQAVIVGCPLGSLLTATAAVLWPCRSPSRTPTLPPRPSWTWSVSLTTACSSTWLMCASLLRPMA